MNCKDGVSVRAYSVGWLLLLSSRQFLRPPLEEVVYQCHASTIKMLSWRLEGANKNCMKRTKKSFTPKKLRNLLLSVLVSSLLTSCYTTNTYSYSLEPKYNSMYRGDTKMQIINNIGTPTRITSVGNGVEILVYENFTRSTIGLGNATAYGGYNSVNAYGNSYSFSNNNRHHVEFYIGSDGKCYQVKTNAKGFEKRREKVKMNDDLRNGLLIGGGTAIVTFLLLLLGGSK